MRWRSGSIWDIDTRYIRVRRVPGLNDSTRDGPLTLFLCPVFPPSHNRSGTTAVVAMFRDDCLWVANAGDSRAVLGTEMKEPPAERSSVDGEASGLVSVRDSSLICVVRLLDDWS